MRFFPLIDFKIITSGSVISEKYITSDAVFNFSKSFGITSDYLSKLYFSLVITRGSTTHDGQIRISFKYRTKKMMHDGIFCHSSLILRWAIDFLEGPFFWKMYVSYHMSP